MVTHIRDYQDRDAEALMRLFYDTVRHVNAQHYTPQQVEAWAPAEGMDVERWRARLAGTRPSVAVEGGVVVGFAELEDDGHIDAFYVHHAHQRQGIGTRLLEAICATARARGLRRLVAAVSITARPFFEAHGFDVVVEQNVHVRGESLRNFVMEKRLDEA